MSCADGLSNHPDRFDVTLIEAQNYCGGQAFSIPIDEKKYGAPWMNQGVQGYDLQLRYFRARLKLIAAISGPLLFQRIVHLSSHFPFLRKIFRCSSTAVCSLTVRY